MKLHSVKGFDVKPGMKASDEQRKYKRIRSFPAKKRKKPMNGRKISASLVIFISLCSGLDKIWITLDNGPVVAWASMKGTIFAKS